MPRSATAPVRVLEHLEPSDVSYARKKTYGPATACTSGSASVEPSVTALFPVRRAQPGSRSARSSPSPSRPRVAVHLDRADVRRPEYWNPVPVLGDVVRPAPRRLSSPSSSVAAVRPDRERADTAADVDPAITNASPTAVTGRQLLHRWRARRAVTCSRGFGQARERRDARLRAQRGRLRGARRAAVRGRVGAVRRGRRGRAARQHLRVRRLGEEGLDRHRARRRRHRQEGRRGRLPRRAVRARARGLAAGGRRRARLRLLRRHRGAARRRRSRARPGRPRAARPAHPAAGHAGAPPGRHRRGRRPGPRLAAHRHHAHPARRRRDRVPEDRVRLRPALQLLRDPVLPRLVPLAPAGRRPRRGAVARVDGRARARSGQRELDLVRQGPRRPAGAGEAAAAARRGRRDRAHPGVLPPAGRTASGPARGDRDHARRRARTSTCPSSTRPRRCCGG